MRSGLLIKFLQHVNPNTLTLSSILVKNSSLKQALKTQAYKHFLRQNNVNITNLHFSELPVIDKNNYIIPNKLNDLLSHQMTDHYTIEMSSGYSGFPLYWPRYKGQDDSFLDYMQMGLEFTFNIDKIPTLFINTFALGTWVTGTKLAKFSLELSNRKSNKLTTVNTGVVIEDAIRIINDMGPYYKQIIIAGYPPFISTIIEKLDKKNINLLQSIKIMAGGEAFSENWRRKINKQLMRDEDDIYSIVSAYGSADTGLEIGYEQPITILLRKLLFDNADLREKYLGTDHKITPHFFQFNPINIFIEELKGELLFTSNSAIPLVRYNLKDSGGIMSFNKILEILEIAYPKNEILEILKPLKLPCCYVFGRSDGTVSIDGMNIYSEEIKQAFDNAEDILFYAKTNFKNTNEIVKFIPNKNLANSIYKNNNSDYKLITKIENYAFQVIENKIHFFIYVEKQTNKLSIKKIKILLDKILPLVLYKSCKGYNTIVNEQLDSANLVIKVLPNTNRLGKIKLKYLLNNN